MSSASTGRVTTSTTGLAAELLGLVREYAAHAMLDAASRDRLDAWGPIRAAARRNWEALLEADRFGQDITEVSLWKLLPHEDGPQPRSHGAFVHPLAPAVRGDLRATCEAAGLVRPDQWSDVGRGLFDLVRRCSEHPSELWQAVEAFLAVPGSMAFTSELISPFLHALRPSEFVLVDAATRVVLNHATGSTYTASLRDYPAAHVAARRLLSDLRPALAESALCDRRPEDVLEGFCHWLVTVRLMPGAGSPQPEAARSAPAAKASAAEPAPAAAAPAAAAPAPEKPAPSPAAASTPTSTSGSMPAPAPAPAPAAAPEEPVAEAPEAEAPADEVVAEEVPAAEESVAEEPIPEPPSEPPPEVVEVRSKPTKGAAAKAKTPAAAAAPSKKDAPAAAPAAAKAARSAPAARAPAPTPAAEPTLLGQARAALARRGQVVLAGPPGNGKSHLARRLAEDLVGQGGGLIEHLVFHAAWRYDDFVQTLRADGTRQAGRFTGFCRQAAARRGLCVLLIDDAERAPLADVFGEALALLDARGREVALAGGGSLVIPKNVRLILTLDPGTIAGRATLAKLLRSCAVLHVDGDGEELRRLHGDAPFVDALLDLRRAIDAEIDDPERRLPLGFFLRASLPAELPDVWRTEVEPFILAALTKEPSRAAAFRWEVVARRLGLPDDPPRAG